MRVLAAAALVVALLCAAAPGAAADAPRGCDPLDPAHCLLPWPNDHFRKDGRLALRDAMMPRNEAGKPVRAADFIALAERESGEQLDGLFQEWLYEEGRPAACDA